MPTFTGVSHVVQSGYVCGDDPSKKLPSYVTVITVGGAIYVESNLPMYVQQYPNEFLKMAPGWFAKDTTCVWITWVFKMFGWIGEQLWYT